ncbi:MAG TPA: BON domain-containing protein [Dehalococcoidia bacterium]|nr:BON domain-containing protein [Dehalococcoidia bacterium]
MVTAERTDIERIAGQKSIPDVESPDDVAVEVNDGIATIRGLVPTYFERRAAEATASRMPGVSAVVNLVEVEPPGEGAPTDQELASAVVDRLRWDARVPRGRVTATVEAGRVTLEGSVDWAFQARAALDAVGGIDGVVGVANLLVVRPRIHASQVVDRIAEALKRSAVLDAHNIDVDVLGTRVILRGHVRSWTERKDAQAAAAAAPGVTAVDNHIRIANW